MFTIVTPVFNKKDFVKDTIQSVLNQSYQDFEYIIIDDGSTDGSEFVVQQFSDTRIKFIMQKNAGVSAARNRGIRESTKEFVLFLDADDIFHVDHLKWLTVIITQYPNYNFFGTGYKTFSNSINITLNTSNINMQIYNKHSFVKKFTLFPFVWTGSVCFRRSFLLKYQFAFSENFTQGEDITFWFKAIEITNLVFCNITSAYYRIDVQDSLTQSNSQDLPEHIQLLQTYSLLQDVDTTLLCYRYFFNQYIRNILYDRKKCALKSLITMTQYRKISFVYMPLLLLNYKLFRKLKNVYIYFRTYLYNSK